MIVQVIHIVTSLLTTVINFDRNSQFSFNMVLQLPAVIVLYTNVYIGVFLISTTKESGA